MAVCYDPAMIALALVLSLAAPAGDEPASSTAGGGGSPHFGVSAQFRPGKAAGTGEVAVTFTGKDPDIRVNTTPPPRLKLDAAQKVLAEKPVPRSAEPAPDEKYLDLTFPVVFPVGVLEPPSGQVVKGSLVYYYCSHRDGWCRKGTASLDIPVKAR